MKKFVFGFILSVLAASLFIGCSEDIDMSERYVFKEKTITDYLKAHEEYSEYVKMLYCTPLSGMSKTTVGQLLSARGHYTVFAPTNEAIREYVDSMVRKEIIAPGMWNAESDDEKVDSLRTLIVMNSIIDGGDGLEPYTTAELASSMNAEIPVQNMYERMLTVQSDGKYDDELIINGSRIHETNKDILATNGVIHCMLDVVICSDNTLGNLFDTMLNERVEGYHVMATMVKAAGLLDSLSQVFDMVYEKKYLAGEIPTYTNFKYGGNIPKHRYYGFTCFAETDEFWSREIGKPALDITAEDVMKYLDGKDIYPNALRNEDYTDEKNLLNQFVTYHLLPERLTPDILVSHYNEVGYDPNTQQRSIARCNYYTTMGKRRLLKLADSQATEGTYLNRFPNIDNGRHGTYKELSCDPDKTGILVGTPNMKGENNLRNAVLYPIDQLLVYDDDTRNNMGHSRLRLDAMDMWKESINNNIRMSELTDDAHLNVNIPSDDIYPYFDDLRLSADSYFHYWTARGWNWDNYMGDEVNITGLMEIVMRMPPVPVADTYELRFACQNGGQQGNRGIFQFFWGSDPDALYPAGIPLDLEIGGTQRSTPAGVYPSGIGWETDQEDDDYNSEVDKKMRNNGFMKGANNYCSGGPLSSGTARASGLVSRRIILRTHMDPDETYYLKFKTCLDDPYREFYLDYLEFCPKAVYDNPNEPEDIW